MLLAGYEQGAEIIDNYREKMFPFTGENVPYKQAKKTIEQNVKKQSLRDQMLYLLKKTSDSAGLSAAVLKLKDHYKDVKKVDDRRVKKIFAEFDKLGISPITLPSS